jgi:hypothetical protein
MWPTNWPTRSQDGQDDVAAETLGNHRRESGFRLECRLRYHEETELDSASSSRPSPPMSSNRFRSGFRSRRPLWSLVDCSLRAGGGSDRASKRAFAATRWRASGASAISDPGAPDEPPARLSAQRPRESQQDAMRVGPARPLAPGAGAGHSGANRRRPAEPPARRGSPRRVPGLDHTSVPSRVLGSRLSAASRGLMLRDP